MNQSITNHGKVYQITSVDPTGTKFILTSETGENVALGMDAAILDTYTKQVIADMEGFAHVDDLKNKISDVDRYLSNNGVYLRMKELVPALPLPMEMLTNRMEELSAYFTQKYPDRIVPEMPVVEEVSMEQPEVRVMPEEETMMPSMGVDIPNTVNVEPGIMDIPTVNPMVNEVANVIPETMNAEPNGIWSNSVDNTFNSVSSTEGPAMEFPSMQPAETISSMPEMNNVVENPTINPTITNQVFTPILQINSMLINHDQKIIRQFLAERYEGYEVNEDFSIARNPRTGETYYLSINEGQVQMINTNHNIDHELEKTSPLTDTRKIYIQNLDPDGLNEIIMNSKNMAEVSFAEKIKAGEKEKYGVDDTQLIEPAKIKKMARDNAMGFISHLTISFLVGVLGGVSLMVIGNSIMTLF